MKTPSDLSEVKKFFKKNEYYVRVSSSFDKLSCIAEFPARTVIKPWIDGKTSLYSIETKGITYFSSSFPSVDTDLDLIEEKNKQLDCPTYSRRIIIFSDIVTNAARVGLTASFIFFTDSNGDELSEECSFIDILDPPETEEDKDLEVALADLFYRGLQDPTADYTKEAEQRSVGSGYKLLTNPFV